MDPFGYNKVEAKSIRLGCIEVNLLLRTTPNGKHLDFQKS